MQINLLMGGSNSKPEKQYPKNDPKIEIDPHSPNTNNLPPRPPVSPSNQNTLSRSIPHRDDGADYLSRFVEELPEDRLHKSKSRSMKLNRSNIGNNSSQVETKLKLKENVVTVKEQPPVVNSNLNGVPIPGFETEEYQQKKFKKFSINALIKEKDMIKESNYFDESRYGEAEIKPVVDRGHADFRVGEYGQFQTFQVKTYLYDRNLSQQLTH